MKVITYKVRGGFNFPLDMLRYDGAYPNTSDDVRKIMESLNLKGETSKEITIGGTTPPTIARWASFGWKVFYVDGKAVKS